MARNKRLPTSEFVLTILNVNSSRKIAEMSKKRKFKLANRGLKKQRLIVEMIKNKSLIVLSLSKREPKKVQLCDRKKKQQKIWRSKDARALFGTDRWRVQRA